ncbi:methyl-accepting chemotaxis protein [bacterium]|nr:methyl-accepting chemotaxis protein [bacterium]
MFYSLKLKYKLMLFPVFAACCMLILLLLIYGSLNQNRFENNKAQRSYLPALEQCSTISHTLKNIEKQWTSIVLSGNEKELLQLDNIRGKLLTQIRVLGNLEHWQAGLVDSLANIFILQFDQARGQALALCQHSGQVGTGTIGSPFSVLQDVLVQMTNEQLESLKLAFISADAAYSSTMRLVTLATLMLTGIFIYISFRLRISITNSLQKLVILAREVSQGNLAVSVPDNCTHDVIGDLFQSFSKMINNLRFLTNQVKTGAIALATSAEQISASVAEISSSASLTANAATETNTTVEEVRQTALDSNRKAKLVSESAQNMVQVARDGEIAVKEAIDGMHHVENQMSEIASSMKAMEEHNLAIGEIIETVEDVAEQSRLLAVNASIEAVKAGEHGKGFAVVAQEVRTLAEESKLATKRVRTILDDIQLAAAKAMMQTEMGAKAVATGVHQSVGAGKAIQRLADVVSNAAQSTLQISVSSQEQLVGMDQMVSAMQSISLGSNQNMAATLQVQSASQDLETLGTELTLTLEQYCL